jgi:uncharacterized protein YndB with AHSA1/START domain
MKIVTNTEERQLVVERMFEAPRARVWRAYSDPEILKQWWGPKGWTLPVCKVDFRPGGVWHYCMRSPDGKESWGVAVYQEIAEPERIVYTDAFSDAEGSINDSLPKMQATVTFEAIDVDKTKLTIRTQYNSLEDLQKVLAMGVEKGIGQTLDRLAQTLAS